MKARRSRPYSGPRRSVSEQGKRVKRAIALVDTRTPQPQNDDTCSVCGFLRQKFNHTHSFECEYEICTHCIAHILGQQQAAQKFCPICLEPLSQAQVSDIFRNRIFAPLEPVVPLTTAVMETDEKMKCPVCNQEIAVNQEGPTKCGACEIVQLLPSNVCSKIPGRLASSKAVRDSPFPSKQCRALLACGHLCMGMEGETVHPPCVWCGNAPICLFCSVVDSESPRVLLDCGHPVHLECLLKIPCKKEDGIVNFPTCPACNKRCSKRFLRENCEWEKIYSAVENTAMCWGQAYGFADDEAVRRVMDEMRIGMCMKDHPETYFIAGFLQDPVVATEKLCPVCNPDVFPQCPDHGHAFMRYKCCNCCAAALHIVEERGSIRMFCDRCYGMSVLRDLDGPSPCACTCAFSPHPNSPISISGYCCKCMQPFSFPMD